MRPCAVHAIETGNDVPGLLRCFGVVDKIQMFVGDDAFIGSNTALVAPTSCAHGSCGNDAPVSSRISR